MTIKEIASVANVDKTTVQRWIKKIPDAKRIELDAKCTEAQKIQKEADFTLPEVIAIIRAGGNQTLADLLAVNARESDHQGPRQVKAGALTGALVRELRQTMGAETATAFLFEAAGLRKPQTPTKTPTPSPVATLPAPSPAKSPPLKNLYEGLNRVTNACQFAADGLWHWELFGLSGLDFHHHRSRAGVPVRQDGRYTRSDGEKILNAIFKAPREFL